MTKGPDFGSLLRSTPNSWTGDGVDEAEIVAAEAVVGGLPADYRLFLNQVGWAVFNGTAVWGLGKGFPYEKSFVAMTIDERADYGLPDDLVAFSNNGAGDLLCFQKDSSGTLGGQVVIRLHETRTTEPASPSFTAWIQACAGVEHSRDL